LFFAFLEQLMALGKIKEEQEGETDAETEEVPPVSEKFSLTQEVPA
jgi:hypothetical protein